MPTQKQILASIDERLAPLTEINQKLDKLLAGTVEPPPVVNPAPTPAPGVSPSPAVSGYTRSRDGALPKIVRSPADLVADRLVLPFDRTVARGAKSLPSYTYTPGAWKSVGLMLDMGSTGERQEIGLVTEAVADWLTGGSPNNMLVQAEAHGSVPVHWLDPDGLIYSVEKWPRATILAASYVKDPLIPSASSSPVRPEASHYPALCYVPYLATGDQYYLEELQFAATYPLIWSNPQYRKFDKGLLYTGQTRGYAWNLRDLCAAYLATPEGDLPKPLLPKAYWGRMVENNRIEFERRWVNNGDNNPVTGCHFAVDLDESPGVGPWQQDMLGAVLGWMIWTGDPLLAKWRSNYEWHMRQAIDRTSGQSGYPRSCAVQYYYTKLVGVTDMASLAAANGLIATSDGRIPQTDKDRAYTQYLRANLKLAALNGIPDAQACFEWLDPQLTTIPGKWAV